MTQQSDLEARYGAPSPVRRQLTKALVVLLAVVFLGWVMWAAFFHSTPEARSGIIGYDVQDEHTVVVTLEVELNDVDDADCLVRALSADKAIVGELAFTGVNGRQEVTVRTERQASTAEVLGCTVEGQPRRR